MKLALMVLTILGSALNAKATTPPGQVEVQATCRVTYYTHSEPDNPWGQKVAWWKVKKATPWKTVAVDSSKIPFGTQIFIPGLSNKVFVAEDTGSAVKSMKAISKSKRATVNIVIDVYVESEAEMRRLSRAKPMYLKIFLLTNTKEPVQLANN